MKTFIIEFNERCEDVQEYLLLLEFMDSIATNKHKPLENEANDGNNISYTLSRETQKILRANFYLLLYNLIEATTNSIITVVKDTINDEGVTFFQKIVGTIGCRGTLNIDEQAVKDAMKRTKEHRNKLAHGNWSFSSAGTCLTLSQIKIDYNNVVAFLRQSLNNVEIYLDNKKYLK